MEKNADLALYADRSSTAKLSKSSLVDVFLAESGRLKRIVAGMGLSASDGEDVLQDVSIKALQWAGKFQSRQQSVRWLIKVTVNRSLMEHRRCRTFRRRAAEILKRRSRAKSCSPGPDNKVIRSEELEIMRRGLQQLDGSLLAPMVLRYFCDLNSSEVGRILDLSPSTIRSRLREARLILAKRLMKRGVEP